MANVVDKERPSAGEMDFYGFTIKVKSPGLAELLRADADVPVVGRSAASGGARGSEERRAAARGPAPRRRASVIRLRPLDQAD